MRMKTTQPLFPVLLPLLAWACAPTASSPPTVPVTQSDVSHAEVPGTASTAPPKPDVAPTVPSSLVADVVASGEVTSAGVGYAGDKSDSYAAYEALVATASIDDLRRLVHHDSAIVRAYVAAHLARHDPASLPLVAAALRDDSPLDAQYGCLRTATTVASHVANELCFVRNHAETHGGQAERLLSAATQDPSSPAHVDATHCLSRPVP